MSEQIPMTITFDLSIREYYVVIAALEKHLRGVSPDGWTAQQISRTLEHIKAQFTGEKQELQRGQP